MGVYTVVDRARPRASGWVGVRGRAQGHACTTRAHDAITRSTGWLTSLRARTPVRLRVMTLASRGQTADLLHRTIVKSRQKLFRPAQKFSGLTLKGYKKSFRKLLTRRQHSALLKGSKR